MSIAQRVCEEIVKQNLLQVYSTHPDAKFTVEIKPHAVEQLEALITEMIVDGAREQLTKFPATMVKDEIEAVIDRYSKESSVTAYEAIGALEVVKANLLDALARQ